MGADDWKKGKPDGPEKPERPERPDTAQILLEGIAEQLKDSTVNFLVVIQDDKSSKWVMTNAQWAMGAIAMIDMKIRGDWEMSLFDGGDGGDDEDGEDD